LPSGPPAVPVPVAPGTRGPPVSYTLGGSTSGSGGTYVVLGVSPGDVQNAVLVQLAQRNQRCGRTVFRRFGRGRRLAARRLDYGSAPVEHRGQRLGARDRQDNQHAYDAHLDEERQQRSPAAARTRLRTGFQQGFEEHGSSLSPHRGKARMGRSPLTPSLVISTPGARRRFQELPAKTHHGDTESQRHGVNSDLFTASVSPCLSVSVADVLVKGGGVRTSQGGVRGDLDPMLQN
jgi:hypothetical protein